VRWCLGRSFAVSVVNRTGEFLRIRITAEASSIVVMRPFSQGMRNTWKDIQALRGMHPPKVGDRAWLSSAPAEQGQSSQGQK
jgi:hypothetical protein